MADKDYDFRTVSAKLTQAEFSQFKDYCNKKGLKVSTQIKKLVLNEISEPIPVNIAGRSVFLYNKNKDNFSWKVFLDDGKRIDVEDELSAEYVLQLFETMKNAIDERNTYLKKNKKDSVAVPSKLVRKKK